MGLWVGLVSQNQKIAGFAGSYSGEGSALVLRWLVVRYREQAHSYRDRVVSAHVGLPLVLCFRAWVRAVPGAWLKPGSVRKVMGWPWAL